MHQQHRRNRKKKGESTSKCYGPFSEPHVNYELFIFLYWNNIVMNLLRRDNGIMNHPFFTSPEIITTYKSEYDIPLVLFGNGIMSTGIRYDHT